MGATLSVEEKVYRCAKDNDFVQLQKILQQLQRQGAPIISRYIEFQDSGGNTPLMLAAARGNWASLDMLLRYGAKCNHFSAHPEGSTALHEAVARGHMQCVETLLAHGANPFVENAREMTCVDIAINRNNVKMVRCLELRSHFTGTLQMKVPKFMGLGAEWKTRWLVVMPRFKYPGFVSGPEDRVARSLLVCYKGQDQHLPCCKVWLDGAVARVVIGSQGSGTLQCALALHKNHALAPGAYMTGDTITGFSLHLRPADGGAQKVYALQRFMQIVNSSRASAKQPRPGSNQSSQPASPLQNARPAPSPTSSSRPAPSPTSSARPVALPIIRPGTQGTSLSSGSSNHRQTASDEEVARVLQRTYDAEAAQFGVPHEKTVASFNPGGMSPSLVPSAPRYPPINPAPGAQGAPPVRAGMLQAGNPQASGAVGSPEWCLATAPIAAAPPPSAAVPSAEATQALGSAADAAAKECDDDDAGMCVICLEAPASAGFLHGESVHKCCCRDCAQTFKEAKVPTCPMCRQRIEHVILNFY